jgi:hypothetical protein
MKGRSLLPLALVLGIVLVALAGHPPAGAATAKLDCQKEVWRDT